MHTIPFRLGGLALALELAPSGAVALVVLGAAVYPWGRARWPRC
jgi:hypothetical protein